MQEQQVPLSAVLVERGALAVRERSRSAVAHASEEADLQAFPDEEEEQAWELLHSLRDRRNGRVPSVQSFHAR